MSSSLQNYLDSNRQPVSPSEFAETKLLPPYNGSSWAVWGENTHDLSIFEDAEEIASRLRKDVVLVGANFGGGEDNDVSTMKPFQNFHTKGHRPDGKLRNAVTGTALEGAFMTDLVKNYPTKNASSLARDIVDPSFDFEKHIVAPFRAEQNALGLNEDTLYILMGGNTLKIWNVLVERGVFSSQQRFTTMKHYAAAVNLVDEVNNLLKQDY